MKYKTHIMRSNWNIFLILPLVFISFYLHSCSVKSVATPTYIVIPENAAPSTPTYIAIPENSNPADNTIHIKIEEMPTFQSKDTVVGYPIESKGFPKSGNELGEITVVSNSLFRSAEFPAKEFESDNRTVVGYPVKYKSFPKSVPPESIVYINVEEMPTFLSKDTVVGYPVKSKGFPKSGTVSF